MKILIVNTFHYLRGGDCRYSFSLAELLRSHGHEVRFFGMHHPKNLPTPDSEFFVDYIDFVEMNQRKTPGNALRVLGRSIYSRQARARLSQLLDSFRPDVAHLQNLHAHLTPSVLDALADHGVPAVWTLHDYKLICPNSHLLSHGSICEACKGGRYYSPIVQRCKKNSLAASAVAALEATVHSFLGIPAKTFRFIAPSKFLRDKFIEFGWPREKVTFLRNFLTDDQFRPFEPSEATYALYLGQIEEWKGLRTLLRASELAPEVPIRIVGDGTLRSSLQTGLSSAESKRIEFLGHRNGNELDGLLAGASFLVVPSQWFENCPYVVMEAQARGKPVVASELGGLPELVRHETNGLLFPAKSAPELAAHMRRMFHDAGLRASLGRQASEEAREAFAASGHYAALTQMYSDAVDSAPSAHVGSTIPVAETA